MMNHNQLCRDRQADSSHREEVVVKSTAAELGASKQVDVMLYIYSCTGTTLVLVQLYKG